MRFNEGIEIYRIPPELLPSQEVLLRNRADSSYMPFTEAKGELDRWFQAVAQAHLPASVLNKLRDLSVRLDEWLFTQPIGKQSWHFDYTNRHKVWTAAEQGLIVVGGEVTTDVLHPIEWTEGDRALIEKLKASPEAFQFDSYAPGTFIWSPRGQFVHRRGGLQAPCKRMALEYSQIS